LNLHSADLEEIEARLDDDLLEIENQLRKLDSVGEALAGVTFRLLSESNETRLFVQRIGLFCWFSLWSIHTMDH